MHKKPTGRFITPLNCKQQLCLPNSSHARRVIFRLALPLSFLPSPSLSCFLSRTFTNGVPVQRRLWQRSPDLWVARGWSVIWYRRMEREHKREVLARHLLLLLPSSSTFSATPTTSRDARALDLSVFPTGVRTLNNVLWKISWRHCQRHALRRERAMPRAKRAHNSRYWEVRRRFSFFFLSFFSTLVSFIALFCFASRAAASVVVFQLAFFIFLFFSFVGVCVCARRPGGSF